MKCAICKSPVFEETYNKSLSKYKVPMCMRCQRVFKQMSNRYVGLKAEKAFADYLNYHKIMYLYIGQGANDMDKSQTLKDNELRRPDFLIQHFHSNGDSNNLFMDVKCRKFTSLSEDEENNEEATEEHKYFYLSRKEIIGLWKMQQHFSIPVWIAFVKRVCFPLEKDIIEVEAMEEYRWNEQEVDVISKWFEYTIENNILEEKEDVVFHFAPIDTIMAYCNLIDSNQNRILVRKYNPFYKIPDDFIVYNKDRKLSFVNDYCTYSTDEITEISEPFIQFYKSV